MKLLQRTQNILHFVSLRFGDSIGSIGKDMEFSAQFCDLLNLQWWPRQLPDKFHWETGHKIEK